MMWCKKFAENV